MNLSLANWHLYSHSTSPFTQSCFPHSLRCCSWGPSPVNFLSTDGCLCLRICFPWDPFHDKHWTSCLAPACTTVSFFIAFLQVGNPSALVVDAVICCPDPLQERRTDCLITWNHCWETSLFLRKWWWFSCQVVCNSCDPVDCSPPSPSVHGIFQAGTLEWVAISLSTGSSRSGDQIQVSCMAGGFFTDLSHHRYQGESITRWWKALFKGVLW